ncbi:hypothetical protein SAMN02745751_03578 [Dethiosulfatibacter aminovorans DSM 17477]|uniref:Uncharacterized protein n=1 Tax=Dethiosulfatibacter aminovorans DSM 17477 TaxID=1121476 RepID=A0A1M6MSV8_9FIRM|nr:hypothetical protein [Dethiosulfatibacter aminovorans]SHJ86537.1 hypothetical protein SAMN02745751_03578 [Dethiosulfatibacter aminovorans DSM 17477]
MTPDISLPGKFRYREHNYIDPEFGYDGDFNIGRIKELEDLDYTGSITNELEPLDWFDSWINTDYREDSRGKDYYCFEALDEVSKKFGDQIMNECAYVLNGPRDIDADVNRAVEIFVKDLTTMAKANLELIKGIIDNSI